MNARLNAYIAKNQSANVVEIGKGIVAAAIDVSCAVAIFVEIIVAIAAVSCHVDAVVGNGVVARASRD